MRKISISHALWVVLPTVVFLLLRSPVATESNESDVNVDAFIKNAFVSYEAEFTIDAPLALWNRILDKPLLMGQVWTMYGFHPEYVIYTKGDGLHFIDPSGIVGDMFMLKTQDDERIFYGRGRLKNWGIPFSLTGRALFVLTNRFENGRILSDIAIYGEGTDNSVTRIMLKMISPLIKKVIKKRVINHTRDVKIIIKDVMTNPDRIRAELGGVRLDEYNSLFD